MLLREREQLTEPKVAGRNFFVCSPFRNDRAILSFILPPPPFFQSFPLWLTNRDIAITRGEAKQTLPPQKSATAESEREMTFTSKCQLMAAGAADVRCCRRSRHFSPSFLRHLGQGNRRLGKNWEHALQPLSSKVEIVESPSCPPPRFSVPPISPLERIEIIA